MRARAAGIAAQFPVVGTLVGMYFGDGGAPTNFVEAKTTDEQVYRTFFHAMLSEGVALAPGAYEALFVGLAHTDDVLERSARPPVGRRPPPPSSSADASLAGDAAVRLVPLLADHRRAAWVSPSACGTCSVPQRRQRRRDRQAGRTRVVDRASDQPVATRLQHLAPVPGFAMVDGSRQR